MKRLISKLRNSKGVTGTEYAILSGFTASALMIAAPMVGVNATNTMCAVSSAIGSGCSGDANANGDGKTSTGSSTTPAVDVSKMNSIQNNSSASMVSLLLTNLIMSYEYAKPS